MFDPAQLTVEELAVLHATSSATIADFRASHTEKPRIRAHFLRHLLLRLPAPEAPGVIRENGAWFISGSGIRIYFAEVEGELILTDFRQDSGLPALVLRECCLHDGLNLSHSVISRLSLAECQFQRLLLRGTEIKGVLDFSSCRSPEHKSLECWVDARSARIGGSVLGGKAHLRATKPRGVKEIGQKRFMYALNLAGSQIGGSLELYPKFFARGGVSVRGARIHEDVKLGGAVLLRGEEHALNAQATHIGGVVFLNQGFRCRGCIWLLGARIESALECGMAKFSGSREPGGRGLREPAVVAMALSVGGGVTLRRVWARGTVMLSGAKVLGGLDASGIQVVDRSPDGSREALSLARADIGGEVNLMVAVRERDEEGNLLEEDQAFLQGQVNLTGCRIGGDLFLRKTLVANYNRRGTPGLNLSNATVSGAVFANGLVALGSLLAYGIKIGNDFQLGEAVLRLREEGPHEESDDPFRSSFYEYLCLSTTNAKIGGCLLMDQCDCRGIINLTNTEVGSDVSFTGSVMEQLGGRAMVARKLHVRGDLRMGSIFRGSVDFEHAQIEGALAWDRLRLESALGFPTELSLKFAKIGSALQALNLVAETEGVRILLDDAHVRTLEDDLENGWGAHAGSDGHRCVLSLDGFVYDRISRLPGAEPAWRRRIRRWGTAAGSGLRLRWRPWRATGKTEADVTLSGREGGLDVSHVEIPRLEWLKQQSSTEFRPQPYRHLAKVLRLQGHEAAARRVAIAEQHAMPSGGPAGWVLKQLFGWFFGFGLSERRAIMTLLACIALGASGTDYLRRHQLLVTNVATVNPMVSEPLPDSLPVLFGKPHPVLEGEMPCTQISDVLYAVDIMLPVIPLHQESQCDVGAATTPSGQAAPTRPEVERFRLLKGMYSIVGKLTTTLALLTFSGVLKRSEA